MQEQMKARAKSLLSSGAVNRVFGWKQGEMPYERTPAIFYHADEIDRDFLYDDFCGPNLAKFTFQHQKTEEKTLVFLKPCDTYSIVQLLTEHRLRRESLYLIGVPCYGMIDLHKIKTDGMTGILSIASVGADVVVRTVYGDKTYVKIDVMEERCLVCKSRHHAIYDELIGEEGEVMELGRFAEVSKLEAIDEEKRYAFWNGELSRCIRCNACRNACPACTCESCVFDNPASGISQKVAENAFEESMYHIIRAFHVAGRCTDCGECSRVCPERIPLHLLNRKFIKDIDNFYGDFQAGEKEGQRSPLTDFKADDIDPNAAVRGGNR